MNKLMKIVFVYTFIIHSCFSVNFPKESPEDTLLDNIIVDCSKKANLNCISKNTFHYLENKFNSTDNWEVTENLNFKKNERVIETTEEHLGSNRKSRGIEDITDLLYDKGVRYLRSHDFTLSLPQLFFEGALVKVSAPENSNSRALFQVELIEPEGEEKASSEETQLEGQEGRFFIRKLFGKHIKKKLLLGFFALLLIIKLIKIKLFFLLPLILGVGTVKKLAIKFLFFIFPALATLFKACHHHHHHVPIKQYHVHTVQHSPQETYYEEPVSHYNSEWQRRNEITGDTTASLSSWDPRPASPYYNVDDSRFSPSATEATLFSASFTTDNIAKQKAAQQQAYRFQQQQAAALKIKNQQGIDIPSLQLPIKVGQLSPSYPSYNNDNNNQDQLVTIPATSSTYDPFYSPIVTKLDAVFMQLGFNDEPCRERLVCSMYKTPTRFSPHSNLVSAELSRDPEQLQRPTSASAPVRRFFKYVQAAKDGQDQQDCLKLYPDCTVNTDP